MLIRKWFWVKNNYCRNNDLVVAYNKGLQKLWLSRIAHQLDAGNSHAFA